MLMKLIKWDLLYNWRWFAGLMAALILFGFSGYSTQYLNAIHVRTTFGFGYWINVFFRGATILIVVVAVVQCIAAMLKGYQQSLYGRWGYLTMTLPAKPLHILTSKFITAFLWFNAVMLAAVVSVWIYINFFSAQSVFIIRAGNGIAAHEIVAWISLNLWVLTFVAVIFLSITVANVSFNGKRLGVPGGAACLVVWIAVLFYAMQRIGTSETLSNLEYDTLYEWVVLLSAVPFFIGAFYANLFLIKRKVCLL